MHCRRVSGGCGLGEVGGATFDVDVEQRGRGPLPLEQEADAVRVVLPQRRQQQLAALAGRPARRVHPQVGGACGGQEVRHGQQEAGSASVF